MPTPHAAARYALRRTLPPWCFDERLAELLDFCREAHIGEVIVKVDTEEFTHNLPTVPWLREYLPRLAQARDALREIGVQFSLNPWVTLVHLDRGRDLRATFPEIEWMVGHRGEECRACACPLSVGWREHTRRLWQMYASLKPHVIWVEDDIRTFNHLPARFGCFCRLHMAEFSQRVGQTVDRETLVAAILQPGEPHPWREVWLDLQRDVILDVCRMLAKTVYDISPETFLGLMSSGPEVHCLEGRDWKRLAEALGQGRPIYSRPTLWNYSESSLHGLYESAAQIKRARYVLPPGTIEQTEVENIPFTGYSKSVAFTFLQIALSVSHGCHGATMNLFDHVGSPMAIDPGIQEMLAREYPFVEALAEAHGPEGKFAGVRILHHERASYVRRLPEGSDYGELAPPDYAWERALGALGFPTTYTESPDIAAAGQMLRAYRDEEIREMLSAGLLMDLESAEVLIARGFGRLIGFDIHETGGLHDTEAIGAEELTDPAFGGKEGRYLTMTLPDLLGSPRFGRLRLHPGARPISRLVDPDRRPVYPFVTLFENELGGRVACVPLQMREALGPAFLHPYRRRQMRTILDWLSRGRLPAAVEGGVYPLAYRMDFPDRIMLGVFSLSHDDWPTVIWEIHLPGREPRRVERLEADGHWCAARADTKKVGPVLRIQAAEGLSFRRPLVLALRR